MSEGPADGRDSRRAQEPARFARDAPDTEVNIRAGDPAAPGQDSVGPRGDDPPSTPRRGASSADSVGPRGDDPPSTPRRGATSADTHHPYRRGPDLLSRGPPAAPAPPPDRARAAAPPARRRPAAL